jgi:hypothetical protein
LFTSEPAAFLRTISSRARNLHLTRFDNGMNDHQNNLRIAAGVIFGSVAATNRQSRHGRGEAAT